MGDETQNEKNKSPAPEEVEEECAEPPCAGIVECLEEIVTKYGGGGWDERAVIEGFARDVEELPATGEAVRGLSMLMRDQNFTQVKTVIVHGLLHKAASLEPSDAPLPELEEAILAILSDGVGPTVSGISILFSRFKPLAEACSSPVMGELIRLLQENGDEVNTPDLLPLLLLGTALLGTGLHIPSEVSQSLIKLLSNTKLPQGSYLLQRLEGTPVEATAPEPPTPSKASPSDKTYTESEVKSFLYQRKLEWEGQLRKRDRAIKDHQEANTGLVAEIERLSAALSSCQETLAARDEKMNEAEKEVETLHQKNLEIENKLEDTVVFLREREHQLTTLEAKVEQLDTENAVLGNETRQLAENNKELQSYITELMDRT